MPTFTGLSMGSSRPRLPSSQTGTVNMRYVWDSNGTRYMSMEWTGSGSIVMPENTSARILVVGGGAGGVGNSGAWGPTGGNGGCQEVDVTLTGGQTYSISVGGGGAGGSNSGGSGGTSSFSGTGVNLSSTGGSAGVPNGSAPPSGIPTNNGYVSYLTGGSSRTYSVGAAGYYGSGGIGYSDPHYYYGNGVQGIVIVRIKA